MTENSTPRQSFIERQRDAAVAEARERADERSRVQEIVIGGRRHEHLGELLRIGDDYVVEVIRGDDIAWASVVGGKSNSWRYVTQERAILHLIAQRYDSNPNSNVNAAFYAGRVLGLPEDDA